MTTRNALRFVLAVALSTASLAAAETTFLPGAAEVKGLAGARFSSTLEIANPGAAGATVTIGLVPMEGATAPAPATRTIAAGESLRVREALKTLFGLADGAAGTITVTSDAPLVSSLTTQNVAAPEGAYGLGLLPVPEGELLGAGETGHSIWVSQSADPATGYRTNLSVTLAEAGTVVQVRVLDATGRVVGTETVSGASPFVWQRPVKALAGDADLPVARAEFEVKSGRATAYAVVNDNVTSDAIALQSERVVPGPLDRLVSGAALSPGLLGSYWVTDLRLFNPGSEEVSATIRSVGGPSEASTTVPVPAKGVVEVARVLQRLGFPEGTACALRLTAAGPLLVAARTNNVDPSGVRKGTFSAQQFVTSWPAGLLASGATGFFPGVDQTLNVPGVRTNLTLVGGPEGASGELILRDAAGAEQARTPFTRGAGEWGQRSVADWFGASAGARGALAAATIPENARVDVAVASGALDAYVSRIDNGSGDAVTRPFALPGGGDCSKVVITALDAEPEPILVAAETTFSWSVSIDPAAAELTSQSIRFDGEPEVELDKAARSYVRSFAAAGSRSATLTVRKGSCVKTRSLSFFVCGELSVEPPALPAPTAFRTYPAAVLSMPGATARVAWAVSAGALPPGLQLSPAGEISGEPTEVGAFSFTVHGIDANGCTGTRAYTLVVRCPSIRISPATLPAGTVGLPWGTVSLSASDGSGSGAWSAAGLPPGLGLSPAGVLSGTPTTAGSYDATITYTDDSGCIGTASYTILVCNTLVLGPSSLAAATLAQPYGPVAFTATGAVGATTWTVTGGALPPGLTLAPATGALSGTPSATGDFSFTVTATDANGCTGSVPETLRVQQAPVFTSANAVTFTAGTAGSFTVTTTAFPVAALTSAGALPAGVAFVDNGNGTATLWGTPAAATGGTYGLTFTATNGVAPNGTQAFTLTVNQAPAITSASAVTFTAGTPGSFTVTTTGFPAPSIARGGVALPSGVTFVDNGNGTGTLSGTPAAATGGTYAVTFTATNVVGTTPAQAFTLTVNEAPAITSASAVTFTAGTPGSFTVTTTGFPAPSIARGGVALPSGVSFVDNGNGTGTLSGTPAAGTGGTYAITFTATNGVAPNGTQAFSLTVNQAPAITSSGAVTFTAGTPGTFTVTTTGFPAPSIARGGVTLPAGVTFTDNGNGTGTLAGTPAAATGGTYAITFTATNVVGSTAAQAFTLTVNEAPAITSAGAVTFTAGTAGSFTVTTTGFPAPSIARGGVALPSGVSFVDNGNGTGTLSGTPAAGTGGTYAITFTATNAAGSAPPQAFTLTVNQAPAITSAGAVTFTAGTAGSFTVTTTGFPAPSIARGGVALPSGVSFVDNGNGTGTLSGTPAAGTGGTYAITFTATNSAGSTPAQAFTLTVNEAPAITSGIAATFPIGTPGSFTVTTTGFPAPTIAQGGVALPSGVTFVDNGNGTGTLSGTPAAGTGGTYAITFTATNAAGSTPAQAFTLTVNQPPAITSGNSATFTAGTAGSFTVTTTGFPTPSIARGGVALPSGVSFVDNGNGTGTLSGTPAAGTGGTYAITFTATNAAGSTPAQAFTLTVNEAPAITSGIAATFPIGTPGSFTVTTTGFPVPSIARGGVALPSGVTFVDNGNGTGTLSGTPAAGTGGTYAITFTATNAAGSTPAQAFTLTVNQPPAITSGNSATFTAGTAGSFAVTTTGFPTPALSAAGPLPSGVTFTDNGNGTATLAGTPAAGTGGTYSLTITAANAVLPNATQAFTLTVNQPPAITSANATNATIGVALGFTVTTTGSPTAATITYTGTLPAGVTFTNNGNGTATLGGTPAAGTQGPYNLTITASNGVPPNATQAFTLTVVNRLPVLATDPIAYSTAGNTQLHVAGASLAGVVSIADAQGALTKSAATDLDGDPIAVVPATGASTNGGQYTIAANGSFTYVPAAGYTGADSFTYQVSDGIGATSGTVNVTVGQRVWYVRDVVDGNNAAGGDGRSTNAFDSIAAFNAATTNDGDVIFVFRGNTGSTALSGGFTLKNGQKLWGEGIGLTVAPYGPLVPAGLQPRVNNGSGDAVSVPATAGSRQNVEVRGLDLTGSGNAVDVTASGANAVGVLISSNTISGAGVEGIDLNAGSTGAFAATVSGNTITSTGNGVDARTSAATTMTLDLSNLTVTSNGTGILVDGAGGGTTTITGFANNAVSGNTLGTGISVNVARFDAVPGGAFDTVSGGTTTVGASGNGVGASGVVLTSVSGDLSFTDLDVYADAGAGLRASGTTAYTGSAGLRIAVGAGVGTIEATGGPAVDVTQATLGLPLSSIRSTGSATTGVALSSVLGTFSAGAASSISGVGAAGTSFLVASSNATITYNGTINATAGKGVDLTSNTGSTISFTGALTLSTGSSTAFNATGGGTVSATNTTSTLTTTTGTALNVQNTTIGASNLEFRSITANGGANGIVLQNTGSSGGLKVRGDNSSTTKGGNATGGTIRNMVGADGAVAGNGIYLENTSNVLLQRMQLNDFQNSAIRGLGVSGFTLQYSTINGVSGDSSAATEGAVTFGTVIPGANGLSGGTNLVDGCVVRGAVEHNMEFYSYVAGSNYALTISNSDVKANSAALGGDGIQIELGGGYAGTATVNVQNCSFDDNKSQPVQATALGSSTLDITIDGNTVAKTSQGNEGFIVSNGANGRASVRMTNNTVTGIGGVAFYVGQVAGNASASSNLTAIISGNTVSHPASATNSAIIAFLTSTVGQVAPANILIDGNNVTENSTSGVARGIFVDTPDNNTTPSFTATITNNTVSVTDPVAGLQGIGAQARRGTGCFDIRSNTVTYPAGTPSGIFGVRLRQASPGAANLEQGGSAGTPATVLAANNLSATTEVLGTVTVVANNVCLVPPS